MQGRGIQKSLADFIIKSPGTAKQYQYAWSKWYFWNSIRFGNSFQTSEVKVLNFLFYLFQIGKSYSVISTHKAMLFQTLPFLGNMRINNTVLISKFMKSFFTHKPAMPRYLVT